MKILLIFIFIFYITESKVLFITHSYNRPDFIEVQVKTFNALLQDDYELVVFNDASDVHMEKAIVDKCNQLGLRCFRIPQHLHVRPGPGQRHMDGIQFSLDTVGYDYNGIVVLIDSDMFLVKPFSVEEYMKNCDLAGDLQGRGNDKIEVRYLSPALAFMNMATLPDKKTLSFEGGFIHGLACDVGAHTYYYMQKHSNIKTKFYGVLHIGVWKITGINCPSCQNMTCNNCVNLMREHGFDSNVMKFIQECPDGNIEFNLNTHFLHYRGGSNWDNRPQSYITAKTNALNNLVNRIVENGIRV